MGMGRGGSDMTDPLTNCHRFTLARSWMGTGGHIVWVMLNPSTADEFTDDPTIRKCVGFSKRWGFSRLTVVNLFGFRATDPADLKKLAKTDLARAIGRNNHPIIEATSSADLVVAAWGTHGGLHKRDREVCEFVIPNVDLYCISLTKDGFPSHPCMHAYTDAPVMWRKAVSMSEIAVEA